MLVLEFTKVNIQVSHNILWFTMVKHITNYTTVYYSKYGLV